MIGEFLLPNAWHIRICKREISRASQLKIINWAILHGMHEAYLLLMRSALCYRHFRLINSHKSEKCISNARISEFNWMSPPPKFNKYANQVNRAKVDVPVESKRSEKIKTNKNNKIYPNEWCFRMISGSTSHALSSIRYHKQLNKQ